MNDILPLLLFNLGSFCLGIVCTLALLFRLTASHSREEQKAEGCFAFFVCATLLTVAIVFFIGAVQQIISL